VNRENFSDAALVVLGHGTELNPGSATPVIQHVAELRRRRVFGSVREAFWKQQPQVKQVLADLIAPRVFVVPLFISEGYFSDEVIPRELGFAQGQSINPRLSVVFYCRPIGTHEGMTNVILARAREAVEKFPFPRTPKPRDTTLVIAGHGTERNENSRKSIERQVELIRGKNLYADVHAVFLDEEPRVVKCYELAQTRNLIVVPFFISEGLHVTEDIPVLLGESERVVKQRLAAGQPTWRNPTERNGKLLWYSEAVGTAPQVADVILERVCEAAAGRLK
jgi:sirohydrochlorin cobaltochelatase